LRISHKGVYNVSVLGLFFVAIWLLLFALARVRVGRQSGGWFSPRDVVAGGLLALAVVGFFWRLVVGDAYMPADGGDMASFLLPTYRFAQAHLHLGNLPLWNPHLYVGAPFVGDVQSALFYPINLVVWLLSPPLTFRSLEMMSLFHIWWSGLGTYVYLRDHSSRGAAFLGALAFMFSDLFIIHFGNLNLIAVASWFPWTFWAFEKARSGRRWRWAVLAGIFLGVGTLAGHPQVTLFIGLALVMDAALWVVLSGDVRLKVGVALTRLALTGIVAFGISAVILLPAAELTRHTVRAAWNYGDTVAFSLAPAQWIGMVIPGFFGRSPQFQWSLWPRVEVGYVGILTLVLAGFAVAMKPDRRSGQLAALAGMSLLFALGVYSVTHGWLTALVPGLSQLRAPARFVFIFDFALVVLAARGLDALREVGNGHRFQLPWRWLRRVVFLVWLVPVPLAYGLLIWGRAQETETFLRVSVMLIAVVFFALFLTLSLALVGARRHRWLNERTFVGLAVALLFFDLASLGAYNDIGQTDPASGFQEHGGLIAFLKGEAGPFRIDSRTDIDHLWQPDMALYYGLDDVGGIANPLALADAGRFWETLGSRSSPLYDFLNVAFVVARKDVVLDWDKFELAWDDDPTLNVYRNKRALSRAYVVYRARAVSDQESAWTAIHAAGFDPAREVIIEGGDALVDSDRGPGDARIVERDTNGWTLEVVTAAPAYLVLSEVYYPGWLATVDGRPAPVLRANAAFRAVPLPEAGQHRIRLWYAPGTFIVGAILSGLTIAFLLVGVVLVWRRPQRG